MPELPEVETIVRGLAPKVTGQTITAAHLRWARTLAAPAPKIFYAQILGRRIQSLSRRAKYLVFQLDDFSLLVHLRMSGDLFLRAADEKPAKHDRLLLTLSNGQSLAFNDTRKFGRVWLTNQPQTVLGKLGPEPLEKDFTPQWLYQALQNRKRQMKPLLLDQTFLAGLGNIYTDEALHLAKLHPQKGSNTVSVEQAAALHKAIRAVLREGIKRNGASIDWVYRGGGYQNYFLVYDRDGKPCKICGALIQKLTVGQRGTHICPNCQRLR